VNVKAPDHKRIIPRSLFSPPSERFPAWPSNRPQLRHDLPKTTSTPRENQFQLGATACPPPRLGGCCNYLRHVCHGILRAVQAARKGRRPPAPQPNGDCWSTEHMPAKGSGCGLMVRLVQSRRVSNSWGRNRTVSGNRPTISGLAQGDSPLRVPASKTASGS
jgi:hypothetical protein